MVEGNPADTHRRSFFASWWFWLLIISVIALVIALILWLIQKKTPWYFWALLIAGGVLLLVSIILAIVYFSRPSRKDQSEKIAQQTLLQHNQSAAQIAATRGSNFVPMTPTYSFTFGQPYPSADAVHSNSEGSVVDPLRE